MFNVPSISLIQTAVKIKNNKITIVFDYENKGESPAVNTSTIYLYGIDGYTVDDFVLKNPRKVDKIEVGDVFSYTASSLPMHPPATNAIVLIRVEYHDSNKLREFINKKLFGKKYGFINGRFTVAKKQSYQLYQKHRKINTSSLYSNE